MSETLLQIAQRVFADDDDTRFGGMVEQWGSHPVWAAYNPDRDCYMVWICDDTLTAAEAVQVASAEAVSHWRDGRYVQVHVLIRSADGTLMSITAVDDES